MEIQNRKRKRAGRLTVTAKQHQEDLQRLRLLRMCKIMEEMRIESLKEVAFRMLAAGKYALEEIANISGLSLDKVKKLKAERTV